MEVLTRGEAAVYYQLRAGDELGGLGGEVEGSFGDLYGLMNWPK